MEVVMRIFLKILSLCRGIKRTLVLQVVFLFILIIFTFLFGYIKGRLYEDKVCVERSLSSFRGEFKSAAEKGNVFYIKGFDYRFIPRLDMGINIKTQKARNQLVVSGIGDQGYRKVWEKRSF